MCFNFNVPYGWSSCHPETVANCRLDKYPQGHPSATPNGQYVLHLQSWSNGHGIISQLIPCDIELGYEYSLNVFLASYDNDLFPNFYSKPICKISLGGDSCSPIQSVFTSPLLDTSWINFTLSFKATAKYDWLIIECFFQGIGTSSNLLVDAISPISILNAHQVHSYVTDTLLPVGSTACLNLTAYTDTTYKRVWWEQVGIGLIDNQINAGNFCTDTNTTYIIHMLGADSTCAGYLHSSDTVRVRFYDPNGVADVAANSLLSVFPNPTTGYVTITAEVNGSFELMDGLGRAVAMKTIERGNTTLSIEDLPSGVYYYRFTTTNKLQQHGKLVKQ